MVYNGVDYLSLVAGIVVGIILAQVFDFICIMIGQTPKKIPTVFSKSEREELDYVYENTGFTAHKVGDQPLNGFLEASENSEAEKVAQIVYRYCNNGFVFTDKNGRLFGKVCTILTKPERIKERKSSIKIVVNNEKKKTS